MSFLQMSIAGAVMILVITVIRALAINRVPKKTFLALWGAVLIRLLIPFSLPSGLSIYSLLERKASPAITNTPTAVFPVVPSEQAVAVSPQSGSASETTISIWAAVWAVGLILCAAVFAVAYWKCYQEFQMSLPVENDVSWRWLQAHPLRRTISIRQSDRVSSPLTFGVLHPVILMPKKTDWDNELDLHYVLEHEFVHIQRFDTISKFLLIAAACVHWFNPLVWVMYALANRDLELSCDETVVHHFGSGTRASYAKVLIRMEETRSGFAPLCNHFSRNAIEERITAIMKTRKTTIRSLVVAVALVAGTVTVFATSAQADTSGGYHADSDPSAVENDVKGTPDEEYLSAGLTYQKNMWYYQGEPVASIYDENGGIYTNGDAADGIYLNIKRDRQGGIADVSVITKKQFQELVDQYMNLNSPESVLEEGTLVSYVDPTDGKTYYSFDNGETFEPLTDAEFEARFPTPDVEWWTYEEYKAWLENEKVQLQDIIGEKAWTGGRGEFVWTQEIVDETIAMYEGILEDIKNGMMYSKTVDGETDMMVGYDPSAAGTSYGYQLFVKLDNGDEKVFGPYETANELLAEVKPFCEEQVKQGNMTQREADEMISRYTAQ